MNVYIECEQCKGLVRVEEVGEVTCGSCGYVMVYRPGGERLEVWVWLLLLFGLLVLLALVGCGAEILF